MIANLKSLVSEAKQLTQSSSSTNMAAALQRLNRGKAQQLSSVPEKPLEAPTEQQTILKFLEDPKTPSHIISRIEKQLERFNTPGLASHKQTGGAGITPLILALKDHPNTPPELLHKYKSYKPEYLTIEPNIRGKVESKNNYKSMWTLLEANDDDDDDDDDMAFINLATDPDTDPKILFNLANNTSNLGFSKVLANNPNANEATLHRLKYRHPDIVDKNAGTQLSRLADPNFLTAKFSALDKDTRETIAGDKHTHPDFFDEISEDPNWQVRHALASNDNTPQEILHKLAMKREYDTTAAVASHKNTHPDFLSHLYNEKRPPTGMDKKDPEINNAVARNKNTPTGTLHAMATEPHDHLINKSINNNNDAFSRIVAHANVDTKKHVAANSSADPDTLHLLASHPDINIRRKVANNPSTKLNTLQLLSKDTDVNLKNSALNAIKTLQPGPVKQTFVYKKPQAYPTLAKPQVKESKNFISKIKALIEEMSD